MPLFLLLFATLSQCYLKHEKPLFTEATKQPFARGFAIVAVDKNKQPRIEANDRLDFAIQQRSRDAFSMQTRGGKPE